MKIWEGTVASATNSKLGTALARSPVVEVDEIAAARSVASGRSHTVGGRRGLTSTW